MQGRLAWPTWAGFGMQRAQTHSLLGPLGQLWHAATAGTRSRADSHNRKTTGSVALALPRARLHTHALAEGGVKALSRAGTPLPLHTPVRLLKPPWPAAAAAQAPERRHRAAPGGKAPALPQHV